MSAKKPSSTRELIGVLAKLPPAPIIIAPDKEFQTVCGDSVPAAELEILNTGVVAIVSDVQKGCARCAAEDRKTAKLVCVRCKAIAARMKPHRDPDGFIYKAGASYHLDGCAVCGGEDMSSIIIEKRIYETKNKTRGA